MKLRYQGTIDLPKSGSWPESVHEFEESHCYALMAAEAAGRPLLVRGEPGIGKSQLARAAAVATGRLFQSVVVNARTECEDLQWKFDAVARLGEAQILGLATSDECRSRLNPKHFLSPGPLWWALNWESAKMQHEACINACDPIPDMPEAWNLKHGSVLLIDEIDKADTDLPNSLLETLGNGDFKLPYIGGSVRNNDATPPPLVIITTNEERELPAAFVRRCLVLSLNLPDNKEGKLVELLCRRGRVHYGSNSKSKCSDGLLKEAAEMLVEDRDSVERGQPRPGQAEYLDLLRAVIDMEEDEKKRIKLLKTLREFVYCKAAQT